MEIEDTSLWREIEAVKGDGAKPVHYTWRAEIHANGLTYAPLKLLSIDIVQDFEQKYADEIIVTMMILGGTFAKRIYPFQDSLDITLYRDPLQEVGDASNEEGEPQSERYTATLLDKGNPLIEANGSNNPDEDAMNLNNLFEISFQLVGKGLEQLRMKSVGRIYRNADVESVIRAVLTNDSKEIQADAIHVPKGVTMVEASNKTKRDHVVLPHGIKLVEVPEYIQYRCGGVYNAGMGYYLRGDQWYVYPCYDTTRFNKATKTMTVINVPKNKMPNIERTYRINGRNLLVLATGEVKLRDDSEKQQLNHGNGVRFADAKGFMDGSFVQAKGNKVIAQRGKNTSEFVGTERKNGNNNVHISTNPINANPFVEYSRIARRQGGVLTFVWENSQTDLLYPGMMVKILYMENGDVKEVYGTALKAHHYVQLRGQGSQAMRYICQTVIAVFVQLIRDYDE